jgi:hypothetical protein
VCRYRRAHAELGWEWNDRRAVALTLSNAGRDGAIRVVYTDAQLTKVEGAQGL